MTEFGKSPSIDFQELGQMGYRIVIYPVTALRSALFAARQTLEAIHRQGHQRDRLSAMLTRAELYDLLGYQSYEERDRHYFS
jgi:methylisocitrate lyase